MPIDWSSDRVGKRLISPMPSRRCFLCFNDWRAGQLLRLPSYGKARWIGSVPISIAPTLESKDDPTLRSGVGLMAKTILVTGAADGIGLVTARALVACFDASNEPL